MADEKDRRQQDQPAEDLTPEMQKEIISIAASYTSRPASKLTLREALEILRKNGELSINSAEYEKAARISAELVESYSEMQNVLAGVKEAFSNIMRGAATFLQSEEWQKTRAALAEIAEKAPLWLAIATEISELEPYIRAEMEKPEYKGMTLEELYQDGTDDNGDIIPGSLFEKLLQAAGAARDKEKKTTVKRVSNIEYPLDKPNLKLWGLTEKQSKGDITFEMAKRADLRKGISLPAGYAINFDDLSDDIQITKNLLPFDKLVYIAAGALFNAGNNIVSLSQFYYVMGYTGTPGDNDREKIYKSITKLRTADIRFDNEKEAAKYKYPHFRYEGSLFPCEIVDACINGIWTDKAIHIFREPPLITFAKQRDQITTLDIKLLQAPISKTDANLKIQDYLLIRISRAKNDKRSKKHSCRILFETLYKETGITTKKQIYRAQPKIEKFLQYYQQQDYIARYTTQDDGITIFW